LAGAESASQLASLNAVYPVLKTLPMALWRDTRGRQEGLHNFLLVMDEFTRLENGQARLGSDPRALA
jgi:type III secretion protein W